MPYVEPKTREHYEQQEFFLLFAMFLAYWIVIISSVRIFDMTFNVRASLQNRKDC